jgi:hypothetical protein
MVTTSSQEALAIADYLGVLASERLNHRQQPLQFGRVLGPIVFVNAEQRAEQVAGIQICLQLS